ncbi:MAG: PIN domain-containing protein, partial [Cyanobacteria bacterium J06607_17]
MKKTFVLDTNVLLHDPKAIYRFEENDVILPIAIIEELDRFKKSLDETGRNARQVSRTLDKLRNQGSLVNGICLDGDGILKVSLCHQETLSSLPLELEGDKADNEILAVALEHKQLCNCPVVLISKDTNLRIKADTLGLAAEDYETDKIDIDDLYSGTGDLLVDAEQLSQLFRGGTLELEGKFYPNQSLTLIDVNNPAHTALAMVDGESGRIIPLPKVPYAGISQVHPRNREQK